MKLHCWLLAGNAWSEMWWMQLKNLHTQQRLKVTHEYTNCISIEPISHLIMCGFSCSLCRSDEPIKLRRKLMNNNFHNCNLWSNNAQHVVFPVWQMCSYAASPCLNYHQFNICLACDFKPDETTLAFRECDLNRNKIMKPSICYLLRSCETGFLCLFHGYSCHSDLRRAVMFFPVVPREQWRWCNELRFTVSSTRDRWHGAAVPYHIKIPISTFLEHI